MNKNKETFLNFKRKIKKKYDPSHPMTHIINKIEKGIKVVVPFKPDKVIKFDEYKKDCYEQEILISKKNIENIEIEKEILDKKDKIGLFIKFSESSKMKNFKEFIVALFRNFVLSTKNTFLMISGDLKDNIEVIKNKIISKNIFDNYFISKLSIRFYTYYDLLFFDQTSILNNDTYKKISGFEVNEQFDKEYINDMKRKMRKILEEKKNQNSNNDNKIY